MGQMSRLDDDQLRELVDRRRMRDGGHFGHLPARVVQAPVEFCERLTDDGFLDFVRRFTEAAQ